MTALVLFASLSTTFFYLGSRATITSFLWSRYPKRFAKFADCPACSGAWYGLALAIFVGSWHRLPLDLPYDWSGCLVTMWLSIVWTPIGAAILQKSLETVGTVIPDE